jgi:hypothetical protein
MSSLFNQNPVSHGPFQAPCHLAPNSFATTKVQPQIHTSFYPITNKISNPQTQPSSHQNMVPQWTNCSLYVHYLIQPPDPPPAQPLAHSTTTPSPTHQPALLSTLPLVYVQLSPTVYQANQPKGPQWSHLQLYNPAQGTIPGLTTGPILNQHLAFPGPKVQDPSGLTPTTWSTILSMPPLVPGPTPTTHPV